MMLIRSRFWIGLVLLIGSHAFAATDGAVKETWPMRQGMHEYKVPGGKLLMTVSTYQDTTTFRRNYHFFYVTQNSPVWNQVPVVKQGDELDFAPASASGGDVTLEDWLVVPRGTAWYVVRAVKHTDKGAHEKAEIKATWYKFVEAPDDAVEGPAYAIRPVFVRAYNASAKITVDAVLRKESTLEPSK